MSKNTTKTSEKSEDPVIPDTLQKLVDGDGKKHEVQPDWQQVLYTPDRVKMWLEGTLTLQELHAITGPEMLEMALIGFRNYEQGKLKEAKTLFLGLSELDPKESYYRTALGACFLAEEDLEGALLCFNQAIKINPKEIASFVNRGEVFLRQGKVLEAAQDFKSAVDLDPKGADPLTHRARVLAAAALEMIEQATKEYDAADKKGGGGGKAKAAPPGKKSAGKKK